jgi:hypothetical protein
MTRMRDSVLAGLVIAVTAAAAGCGGPTATSHTPTPVSAASTTTPPTAKGGPAEPPPGGYRWAGSAAQGVWFAVPATWAAINLAKMSATKAINRFVPPGTSSSSLKAMLTELSHRHAFVVADLASAVRSPHHFATNGNVFCMPTALAAGAGSSPALKAALRAEYAQIHAHVLAIENATIDGDPGVRSEFTLPSRAGVTVSETQYAVLAKNSRVCTVTLSTDNPAAFRHTFNKIGHTIRVT